MSGQRDQRDSSQSLLTEFLNSGRSEESFRRLVASLSGLIYGSALRRTSNPQLAEEITQNVFTILAQKAESLVHHPSLTAWIHRTTRYESEKLLRKEIRHRRRLEKLAQEPMHSSTSPSNCDLPLLENALDQFSTSDRELVLARFYQGKKFREIAQQTNRTEAACKVRLSRTLKKMSTWLSRRGYTLTTTTLATILSKELTQAAPLKLSSLIHLSAKQAPLSSSFSPLILHSLATMKASQIITISLASLLLIAGIPLAIYSSQKNSSHPNRFSITQSLKSTFSQNKRSNLSSSRRWAEQQLLRYPKANERLEELYTQFPNLRPTPFVKPQNHTILEEFKTRFAEEDSFLKIPKEIKKQILDPSKWDQEIIGSYLAKHEELLSTIVSISKLSNESPTEFLRCWDSVNEIKDYQVASELLILSILHSIRSEELEKANNFQQAHTRFGEAFRNSASIHNISALTSDKSLNLASIHLINEGYALNPSSPSTTPLISSLIESERRRVSSMISFLEVFQQSEDKDLLIQHVEPVMGFAVGSKGETLLMALDIRQLQYEYAEITSNFITIFEDIQIASQTGDWSQKEEFRQSLNVSELHSLPEPKGTFYRMFLSDMAGIAEPLFQYDYQRTVLKTLDALNQAKANGLAPASLEELVPDFLAEVPRHPLTQEPLANGSVDIEKIIGDVSLEP